MFIAVLPNGHRRSNLALLPGTLGDPTLARRMFNLSRTTDMGPHDPTLHTLDAIAAGIPGHIPLSVREVPEAEIPSDRFFRDAWEDTGVAVIIEMAKARAIQHKKMARARRTELTRLDRLIDESTTSARGPILAQRQVMENFVPADLDLGAFTTPAALKAAWPAELPNV